MFRLNDESAALPAGHSVRHFQDLGTLFSHYARTASERVAVLAPRRGAASYAALARQVNDSVGALRACGIGRQDRIAVVLPDGSEAAVAVLAVAVAAVCVPMNAVFTADEWRRYLGDFKITALLTRAGSNAACRAVAHDLAIPVIDLFSGAACISRETITLNFRARN